MEVADHRAVRFNRLISQERSKALSNATKSNTVQLWSLLKTTNNVSPVNLYGQYGFNPTGSSTAALVDFTYTVTVMLETNKYVRCLLIDFSKAFDSVDYAIIVKKLVDRGLDQNVIDWVVSFLSDRQQYRKVGHKTSGTRIINRSVVQGSGVGGETWAVFTYNPCHIFAAARLNKSYD